jgi:hypothetical protein
MTVNASTGGLVLNGPCTDALGTYGCVVCTCIACMCVCVITTLVRPQPGTEHAQSLPPREADIGAVRHAHQRRRGVCHNEIPPSDPRFPPSRHPPPPLLSQVGIMFNYQPVLLGVRSTPAYYRVIWVRSSVLMCACATKPRAERRAQLSLADTVLRRQFHTNQSEECVVVTTCDCACVCDSKQRCRSTTTRNIPCRSGRTCKHSSASHAA